MYVCVLERERERERVSERSEGQSVNKLIRWKMLTMIRILISIQLKSVLSRKKFCGDIKKKTFSKMILKFSI
jgi:hypothetical protein